MQSIPLVSSGFAHCTALCSGPSINQHHKPCLCTRRATNMSHQEALSDPSPMHAERLSALVRKQIWKNLHADDVPSIVRSAQKPLCRNEYRKFPCSSPRHLAVFTGFLVPFALQSHVPAMAVTPQVKGYIREGKGTGKGRYENNSICKREDQTTRQENGTARLFHLRL